MYNYNIYVVIMLVHTGMEMCVNTYTKENRQINRCHVCVEVFMSTKGTAKLIHKVYSGRLCTPLYTV